MKLGLLSDLHHTSRTGEKLSFHNAYDVAGALARAEAALAWFAASGVDAVAIDGDLTNRGEPAELEAVLAALLAGWDGRAFVVAGNHDEDADAGALAAAVAAAGEERLTLADPAGTPVAGYRLAGVAPGELPDLTAWGEEPVLLLSHFPPLSRAAEYARLGLPYAGDLPRREELAAALRARSAPTVVVNGHLHTRDVVQEGPLLQLSVAALVEPPYEATIVELDGKRPLTVRREARAFGTWDGLTAPELAPASAEWRLDTL